MSLFEEDLDLSMPEIGGDELRRYLEKKVSEGITLVEKAMNQYKGVQNKELPENAFSLPAFQKLKRAVAIYKSLLEMLPNLLGEPIGLPVADLDDTFFGIVSQLRGYDVTKYKLVEVDQ
jgi:hypothetical protein